jgi:hypothetical protein
MVTQMNTNLKFYRYLHEFNLPNSVPLPNWFDPVPTMTFNTKQQPIKWNIPADVAMPAIQTNWRFIVLPNCLLLGHHKITSVQLTVLLTV